MDDQLILSVIFIAIAYLVGFVIGYQFGKSKIKPCLKCKADDLETQRLLKQQEDLSKGF